MGEPAPLKELRQAYFEGLNWVLRYYYCGVASWTWYYPFHYAPMASDLSSGLGQLTASFDYGIPFRPFEQLLAVQPPASATLLPEPFRWLMTAPPVTARRPSAHRCPVVLPVSLSAISTTGMARHAPPFACCNLQPFWLPPT